MAFLLVLIAGKNASGQLVLNEVCSKNNTVLADAFGDHPDWVEVHNPSDDIIALDGFYLSNKASEPAKWQLPAAELQPGEFAVLFSGSAEQGDHYFPFKISQAGESLYLSNTDLEGVDVLHVPYLQSDHSYGRTDDGLRFFAAPTPAQANTTQAYVGYAPVPVADRPPGYHSDMFALHLSAPSGFAIHVTWDGKDADTASPIYTVPLEIATTSVVKAISMGPDHLPSDQFTGTYAIGSPDGLPMVSLSTDPDSLWDWERGIYVLGPYADTIFPYRGANFWRGNHIPAHVEYFDGNGHLGLSQRVDLRIHGGSQARTKPQRPLRLTARKRYGEEVMAFPFFEERGSLDRFKHLVLRNSSGDFCLANFRDGSWHQIALHNDLDIDVLGFDPVRLFLNGEYWGIMNLRERISVEHLANNYGADKDLLLLMDKENTSVQGDTIHFHELKEYIQLNDLNDPMHWAHVEGLLDIPSLKDYFALEIYAGNADWPANNIRYWKPSVEEGKWRYILHDLDATMNVFGWIPMDINMFWEVLVHRAGWTHSEVFRNLLENDEFERTFINRLADLLNTTFSEHEMLEEVDVIRRNIVNEIPSHFDKWGCHVGDWNYHALELIPEFARIRTTHVREHVLSTFDLPNLAELEISVFPEGAGAVQVNTIRPELPFTGTYFNGNAIDLNASSETGWEFDHWEYATDAAQYFEGTHLQMEFPKNGRIMAYFRAPDSDLIVFPNPCKDQVNLSIFMREAGPAIVTIADLEGREINQSNIGLGEGVNALQLELGKLSKGSYLITVRTESNVRTARLVKG